MRVFLDDQILSSQRDGGISRYFVELMRAFRSDASLEVDLATPRIWTVNRYMIDSGFGQRLPSPLGKRGRVARFANRLQRPRGPLDVIHHTYYLRQYLGRPKQEALRVVTVFDMIPELYPELFPHGNPHQAKRAFVDSADLVLFVSESARRDLVDLYGTPSAPMVVTPLGVAETFHPDIPRPRRLPERYVLFVGARAGYKDFAVAAEAFAVRRLPQDVQLVAVGGGPLSDQERLHLQQLGISQRVFQESLTDVELAGAYANAAVFVFPSRYEGFGLPTLEAMASGCLTVLADSPAHREVGGDAALFFPPGDSAELARLLHEVLESRCQHAERRDSGIVRASHFTWRETARLTAAAYHKYGAW